jgi:serine phosphatase RsbU (regulator of sigma subunit)
MSSVAAVTSYAPPATQDRGRLLVADDQPAVREALRFLLKSNGYDVRAVASPAAVLEAMAAERFDLLLMDLNFARDTTTGREGLELVPHVRALDPVLPVMVMTAWSTVPLAVAIMREGVCDFVEKPWDNARVLASVAQHVENGHRQRRTRRLETDALAVQHRLLTKGTPAVPGYDIGAGWSFAEALGGDAWVVAPRPGGGLAVAIADVCGKGLPAALLMASALATLEDLLAADLGPGAICGELSRLLAPRLGPERFVSFACATFDPRAGTLRYANAGHPSPLLLAGGDVHRLASTGPVLGVVADAAYEERTLPWDRGHRLVLFTDGVLEAPGASGEELGEARLLERVRALAAAPAAVAAEGALSLARTFAGGTLADDATVVVVDRIPFEEEGTLGPRVPNE